MRCINSDCGYFKMLVINSREIQDGTKRRRRYRCPKCKMTYITLEKFTIAEDKFEYP